MKKEKRVEIFNKTVASYEEQGYKKSEHTISILKANIMALVTAGPIAVALLFIYALIVPDTNSGYTLIDSILFLVMFILSIFIHELLHGLGWGIMAKNKGTISFGVMWKELTPYCTCCEPLECGKYMFGCLLPFLVLGIGGFLVAVVLKNDLIMYMSALNVVAAGGDTTIFCMLLKYRKSIIIDHPVKCGFVALDR